MNKFYKGRGGRENTHTPPSGMSEYEKSVWVLSYFNVGYVKLRYGESPEALVRRFKRKVADAGTMRELKMREYYLPKSQKIRETKKRALKRLRKKLALEAQFEEDDTKPARKDYTKPASNPLAFNPEK